MTSLDEKIYVEQVRLLYANARRALPLNTVNGLVLAFVLWEQVPRSQILAWLAILILLTLLRDQQSRWLSAQDLKTRAHRAGRLLNVGVVLTGATWGLGAVLFAQQVTEVYQAFILVILAGVGAGAVVALATVRYVFLSYLVPLFGPLAVFLLTLDDIAHRAMGALAMLLAIGLPLLSSWNYRQLKDAIGLRFERDRLLATVEETNRRLESANEQLRAVSLTDGLTGVPNRRHFDRHLQQEWTRAKRSGSALSLVMFDIDYFKHYNDKMGHLQGDDCLRQVASAIRAVVKRPGDLLARYGGEEFGLLLPETEPEGAARVAEDARARVEEQGIPHTGSAVAPHVTISAGVATLVPSHGDSSPDLLVDIADQALYEAKQQGRNRVVSASKAALSSA